jgi:membrane peptidoglycan carboxypeptidase
MRKLVIWFTRTLGMVFLILLLVVAVFIGWDYRQTANSLPEHRLADGKTSWRGCVPLRGRHQFVPLTDIPSHVVNAFLAAEDPDFFNRKAFNPLTEITEMLLNNKRRSTGSQYGLIYARMLLACHDGTAHPPGWHFRFALLTYRIERDVPKRNILETVMNSTYFGRDSYGIAAAAETYFHKPVAELDLAEAAWLGGIFKSPSTYGREYNADKGLVRRNQVLKRMVGMGAITSQQAEAAKLRPFVVEKQIPNFKQAPKVAPTIAR